MAVHQSRAPRGSGPHRLRPLPGAEGVDLPPRVFNRGGQRDRQRGHGTQLVGVSVTADRRWHDGRHEARITYSECRRRLLANLQQAREARRALAYFRGRYAGYAREAGSVRFSGPGPRLLDDCREFVRLHQEARVRAALWLRRAEYLARTEGVGLP